MPPCWCARSPSLPEMPPLKPCCLLRKLLNQVETPKRPSQEEDRVPECSIGGGGHDQDNVAYFYNIIDSQEGEEELRSLHSITNRRLFLMQEHPCS